MHKLIQQIKKLNNYLKITNNDNFKINYSSICILSFFHSKGLNCYQSCDYFLYDINNNDVIFRIKETPAGMYQFITLKPDKFILNIILRQLIKDTKQKYIDDFFTEMFNIKLNEILNGNSLLLEKQKK